MNKKIAFLSLLLLSSGAIAEGRQRTLVPAHPLFRQQQTSSKPVGPSVSKVVANGIDSTTPISLRKTRPSMNRVLKTPHSGKVTWRHQDPSLWPKEHKRASESTLNSYFHDIGTAGGIPHELVGAYANAFTDRSAH